MAERTGQDVLPHLSQQRSRELEGLSLSLSLSLSLYVYSHIHVYAFISVCARDVDVYSDEEDDWSGESSDAVVDDAFVVPVPAHAMKHTLVR